ncbi:hypothetical protein ACOZ4N_12215 [Halorientalis pallida]|uniref:hypothetical protein n=1 Tax=Halorientalis pallida TaxID=2479928 RepID=UPI003C6F1CD7
MTAFAGCSDLGSESGPPETDGATDAGTDAPTETATPDTATADARLRAASTALSANNDQFSRFVDRVERDTEEPATFDRTAVTDRLEGVRSDLDAADASGDESQRETAAQLRTLADVQADAAAGFEAFGTASVRWNEDVDIAVEAEQYSQAVSELDGVESALSDARPSLDDALSAIDGIETAALADVSVAVAPLRTAIEAISDQTNLFGDLVGIMRPYFEGTVLFLDGLESYQNGQFGTAASVLSRAEAKFQTASSRADAIEASELDLDAAQGLSEIRCQVDAFTAAADYFERSADAFAAGTDQRGEDLAQQGEAALERCESTDSGGSAI